MLPPDTTKAIRDLLLSDRITYRGSEVPALNKILTDLAAEDNRRNLDERIKTQPVRSDDPFEPKVLRDAKGG